eukprot:2092538-Amphidinium_carterae.1
MGLSACALRLRLLLSSLTSLAWKLCVRCKEDLSHIMFRCPYWHKERSHVAGDDDNVLACVKVHGLLPAQVLVVLRHEPALVYREGVTTN